MITVLICLSMTAFLVYFYCLRLIMLLSRNSWLPKKFIGHLLLGLNVSTILVLFLRGLPLFLGGMRPPDVVLIITFLYFILEFHNSVEVTGESLTDSVLTSCALVSISSIVPLGIIGICKDGLTFRLIWHWIGASLGFAILAKSMYWVKKENL